MTTVTRRINQIKQPYGGYIPVKSLNKISSNKGKLVDLELENIHPSLVGNTVDSLVRYYLTGDISESFHASIMGGAILKEINKVEKSLKEIVGEIDLTDNVIEQACYLSSLEVIYRAGIAAYNPETNIQPNKYTIEVIRELVRRGVKFIDEESPLVAVGTELGNSAAGEYITIGEIDYLTGKGLWDMKVTKNKPTNKHTLQLLVHYLMGIREDDIREEFENVEYLGIYNPRTDERYVIAVGDISKEVIEAVERDVIGY